MDKAFLSDIFRYLVLRDGELILPFMGCIKLEDVPAVFSENGLVITPPSKRLYFDNYSISSNERLLSEYAARKEISRLAARRLLYGDLEEIRDIAESSGRYVLEGFGTFCFDKDDGYTIETDPDFMLSRETFGLSTLDLREEERTAEEEQLVKEKRIAEQKPLAAAVSAEKEPAAEKELVSEKNPVSEEKNPVSKEKNPVSKEKNPVSEKKHTPDQKKEAGRGSKWLLILVLVLSILLILVLLVFILKDELKPLLEKILYSKEELEILNYKL